MRFTTKPGRKVRTRSVSASLTGPGPQNFQDHFSGHAGDYAAFRPQYPKELFRFLAERCAQRGLAWDCATGNGQAALALAGYFEQVVATDASKQQLASAVSHPKVVYRATAAEDSGLQDASVDLLTVAQALHWFDIDAFLAEAGRVLKPGGLLAVWSYDLCRVESAIDAVLRKMFDEVENFWPPERVFVANRYRDVILPWPELTVPDFEMSQHWSVEQSLGYFRTWSATRRYQRARGRDPIALHAAELRELWGGGRRTVRWPLTLRAARR